MPVISSGLIIAAVLAIITLSIIGYYFYNKTKNIIDKTGNKQPGILYRKAINDNNPIGDPIPKDVQRQRQSGGSSQRQNGGSSQRQNGGSSQRQNGGSSQRQNGGSSQRQNGGSSQRQNGGSSQTQNGGSSQTPVEGSFEQFKTTYPTNRQSIETTCKSGITETGMEEKQSCSGVHKILDGLSEKSNFSEAQNWISIATTNQGDPIKVCKNTITNSPIEKVCEGITGTMRDGFGVAGGNINNQINSLQQVCTHFSTRDWGECSRKCKLYMDPGASGSAKYKYLCDNACKVVLKSLCNHDFSAPLKSAVKILMKKSSPGGHSSGDQSFDFKTTEGTLIVSVKGSEFTKGKRLAEEPVIKVIDKIDNYPDTIILSTLNDNGLHLSSVQIDDVYYGESVSSKTVLIDIEPDATSAVVTLYKII